MISRYAAVAVMAATSVALVSCDKFNDPAKVCVDPDTMSTVRNIAYQQALKAEGEDASKFEQAIKQLGGLEKLLPFTLATLKMNNENNKEITCSAQVHLKLETLTTEELGTREGFQAAAKAGDMTESGVKLENGEGNLDITYSRQPEATGKQYVFTLVQAGPLASFLRAAAATHTIHTSPKPAPEVAQPEASPAVPDAEVPASDAPSAITPVAVN